MLNLLPNNKPVYYYSSQEKRLHFCELHTGDHYFSTIWYSQNKLISSVHPMAKTFIKGEILCKIHCQCFPMIYACSLSLNSTRNQRTPSRPFHFSKTYAKSNSPLCLCFTWLLTITEYSVLPVTKLMLKCHLSGRKKCTGTMRNSTSVCQV